MRFKKLRDVDSACLEPRNRVNCGVAVRVNLKVQVGTSGETEVAHASDLLASGYALADCDVKRFHVAVNGHRTVVVLDADPVAVARCWPRVNYGAVHNGQDWGAIGVSDVNAGVERAPTWAESGGESTFSRARDRWCTSCFVSGCASFRSLDGGVELL